MAKGLIFGGLNGGGGSNIKSDQHGTVSLAAGTASLSILISAVNMQNSIVFLSVHPFTNATQTQHIMTTAQLLDSTHVDIKRISSVGAVSVSWTVIEFSNVKSVQRGMILGSTATFTTAINNVDISKSVLFHSFRTNNSGTEPYKTQLAGSFNTSAQLKFEGAVDMNFYTEWQVIEFK